METPEPDDDRELLALERLIRRADEFALAFARVDALPRRRELAGMLKERLGDAVRIVAVDVPPETTDLESLLARVYEAEVGERKVALFVYGVERVLSSVRERNGFLPVLNYKRENLQRAVPCPVVVWLPEFALRIVALGAPDVWAWRSGVFEFASTRDEADRTWETVRDSGSVDEYARLTPDERRARIETLEALYHDYSGRDDAGERSQLAIQSLIADRLGRLYVERPDYETALEWAQRAVELAERVFGSDDPRTLATVNNLGYLLASQGDRDGAERLFIRILKTRERLLGPDHPETLLAVSNLGAVLEARGAYDEAERMYRRALSARERVLGPDHPGTLVSLNNLGTLLNSRGAHKEAESLHRRAMEDRERVLGLEHPFTLMSIANLGSSLLSQGDHEGAELLYRRALNVQERLLGPDHPDTLKSVNNLGALLDSQGDRDGAEQLWRRALEGAERVLGRDHPDTTIYRDNLVGLLDARENVNNGG